MKTIFNLLFTAIILTGCMAYHSPDRRTWRNYLHGASFMDMNETSKLAKRPIFLGYGGKPISEEKLPSSLEYGDKQTSDNLVILNYMSNLEFELYDALRKPGMSVQRAGSDVVVILVRDAIMELNVADISATGADTLKTITKYLKKYDSTYIEIAGYTDSMKNKTASEALSLDMAERVGVYFAQHGISPARLFIVGRGSSRPIAAQDDIGRLTNRRVEIRISPVR